MSINKFQKSLKMKTLFGLLALGALGGIAAFGTVAVVMHKTSSTEFCVSCHSMEKPLAEYQGTIHYQNKHGVRAECADCHIPTDTIDYLFTKVRAAKDIYHELAGTIDTDEAYEARRQHMAETVWQQMKANDSATCRNCHDFNAMTLLEQRPTARDMHQQAIANNQTCIDCHKGIAHLLPDTSGSAQSGAAKLAKAALSASETATQLFTYETTQFFLGEADSHNQGNLLPTTEIEVTTRGTERIQGVVHGWQQDGVDSVIYGQQGKRILSALLGDDAKAAVEKLATVTDEATGIVWHQVNLKLWVETNKLLDNDKALWDYSSELMSANCTGCHGLTPLDHFNSNQWIGVIKGMESRTSLTPEQSRILTQYVQKHASDMTGSKH
ncbi:Cytochrome c-type protein TorY [Photobacterium marinum]|uniref:Cytochrome c-type protein n=2 Tax=Photobacterium marinum TaxID=1056511 RepID=L8JDK9_9GAMM|nr:Cytochrome c-type protein TorY [Photobacterium marinum]